MERRRGQPRRTLPLVQSFRHRCRAAHSALPRRAPPTVDGARRLPCQFQHRADASFDASGGGG
ncbi:hypothetical protein ABTG71_20040, partial [Acinetobacter baumannii]